METLVQALSLIDGYKLDILLALLIVGQEWLVKNQKIKANSYVELIMMLVSVIKLKVFTKEQK